MTGVLLGSLAAYCSAAIGYAVGCRQSSKRLRWGATALFALGFLLVTILIGDRWAEASRPPFKTLYETLLFLVWCSSALYLVLERAARLPFLGAGTAAALALALAYAACRQDLEAVYLAPALQSPWFVPHVLCYFVGYSALLLGTIAAVVTLVRPEAVVTVPGREERQLSYSELQHGCIVIGFVLITAGLVVGAVWAQEAWGNYWAWDPKESWALVSWLTYAVYLHLRKLPGWGERRGACFVLAGFAVVVFTYLGMHLLPVAESSMHVYQ